MATIKDVAKLAGVSHGTVSNFLNGNTYISSNKVKKIEDAIKTLGYEPHATARNLKKNRTMNVGIILPNIIDPCFSQIFTGIENVLSQKQYTANLFTTSEIPAKERAILKQVQQQRMDGIIIATCQPQNSDVLDDIQRSGIKVVTVEREIIGRDYNFISFGNYKSINDMTCKLISEEYKVIAIVTGPEEYYSEKQSINGYLDAINKSNMKINERLIEITNYDKESAFKAGIRLLQLGEIPQAIITTSTQLAEGIMKAFSIYENNLVTKPLLISLSEEYWTNHAYPNITKIARQAMAMGEMSAELLLDNIEYPAFFEPKTICMDNIIEYLESKKQSSNIDKSYTLNSGELKVLMLDSSASYSTFSLLADFKKHEGINVVIDVLSYEDLYEEIKNESLRDKYDVFQIDNPWMPEFAESKCLHELNNFIDDNSRKIKDFIPGMFDSYSIYNGKTYSLPYMYSTQLLYYRKDLFEDARLQRMFYEQHRTELKPPKTWVEFNAIAKFFTRKYNSESPTLYGTTLGGKYSSGGVCEFLPRKWAYGGRAFDIEGNVTLNSKETLRALKNYCESYEYASPESPEHWWGEQVREFCEGKAAMMMLFQAHATDITDRSKSKVVGNIGFDIVPGGKPVLGGWSLAINANSIRKNLAFKFISWACRKEIAIPHTILGGSTPCVNFYKSPELISIHPWLPKALEGFGDSKKRMMPSLKNKAIISERKYEEILGESVYNAIKNRTSPEVAIANASLKLEKLIQEV